MLVTESLSFKDYPVSTGLPWCYSHSQELKSTEYHANDKQFVPSSVLVSCGQKKDLVIFAQHYSRHLWPGTFNIREF